MKYSDLLRSLSGFHGMSKSGRHIVVKQHDERQILYSEKGDTLTITVPTMNGATVSDGNAHLIRSTLGSVVSQFLYSEGVHKTIDEWECNDSPLGGIVRDVDAVRADAKLAAEFKGIGSDMRRAASEKLAEFASKIDGVPSDLNNEGKSALGGFTASEIAKAMANNVPLTEIQRVIDKLPPDVAAKVSASIDDHIIDGCTSARTTEESIEAGKKLFEYFFDRSADEEIQQQQQAAAESGDGEGEGSEGEGEGSDEGEGAEAVAKALEKRGDKSDDDASEEKGSRGDEDDEESDKFAIGSDGDGEYLITPPDVYQKNFRDYTSPALRAERERVKTKEEVLKNDGALLATIRRLLQVRSESVYVGGQKRGKLQRSAVYKVGVPTVGNGDWNSRIWRKRIDSDTLDTAVEVLVDFSGSMNGRKIHAAIASCVKLANCLDKVGIPVAVSSFSDRPHVVRNNGVITGYFKDYDGPCRPQDMLDSMYAHVEYAMGSNPDACGIHYAIQRLAQRREARRVLIVLSDGQPAAYRDGWQEPVLKQVIRDSQADYGVECYGVGIMDDSVSRFYPEYSVLQRADDITRCLTEIIKQKIV